MCLTSALGGLQHARFGAQRTFFRVLCCFYSIVACSCLSTLSVRKLIEKFVPNSVDLNGDIGEVHVVVRADSSSSIEYAELRAMAAQLFSIDAPTRSTSIDGGGGEVGAAPRSRRATSIDGDGAPFAYAFVFAARAAANVKSSSGATTEKSAAVTRSPQTFLLQHDHDGRDYRRPSERSSAPSAARRAFARHNRRRLVW